MSKDRWFCFVHGYFEQDTGKKCPICGGWMVFR